MPYMSELRQLDAIVAYLDIAVCEVGTVGAPASLPAFVLWVPDMLSCPAAAEEVLKRRVEVPDGVLECELVCLGKPFGARGALKLRDHVHV